MARYARYPFLRPPPTCPSQHGPNRPRRKGRRDRNEGCGNRAGRGREPGGDRAGARRNSAAARHGTVTNPRRKTAGTPAELRKEKTRRTAGGIRFGAAGLGAL
ncbi:hypothetical protein GCM10010271_24760 [Streptomyces kurssanovii]|nr:hypothetical protein GCM10010271_24760 [Streptomyces kurssanovii]